ncbi:TPM domain-containing protein [Paraurantiacibacter namhicola]|uniref:TPM domain-containing protein n=1 Tax=Paraurantiacibacter namhicola TaxID=645517 RepID=A0A1C7DAR0_9SPHN|nr:TPM domain-containing protein [Paraurantiacibacter namhicola]ANU08401.1 hypothetical protein A6F65_02115 [Paraurantiacibacter namhicola]
MGYLGEAGHRTVTEAVATAEMQTAGEIVTVIADRSDGYSDIALAWAALASFASITLLALFPDQALAAYDRLSGGWGTSITPAAHFAIAAGVGITVFLLAWAIQLPDAVRFALVPGRVKTERALDRSIDLFKTAAERRTHGRTGILIYLSMQEHRAEIVADEAITSKVAPEVWGEAMAAMLAELKAGRIAEGMVAAVEHVGAVLAEHFPREEDDQNELPDRLIEL